MLLPGKVGGKASGATGCTKPGFNTTACWSWLAPASSAIKAAWPASKLLGVDSSAARANWKAVGGDACTAAPEPVGEAAVWPAAGAAEVAGAALTVTVAAAACWPPAACEALAAAAAAGTAPALSWP